MALMTTKKLQTQHAPHDVARLTHRSQHPRLAPLLAQRSTLRERLTALRDEVVSQRRALHAMADDGSFQAALTRRQQDDALTALEREGGELEGALGTVQADIAHVQTEVTQELMPPLVQEGLAVAQALVDALEHLATVGAAYAAYSERSRHLTGAPLVYGNAVFPVVPQCLRQAKLNLEKLQRMQAQQRSTA